MARTTLLLLTLLTPLSACHFAAAESSDGLSCLREKFELSRDERRRGFLLPKDMTNIDFDQQYTRAEVVARYRLYRGDSWRLDPDANDVAIARQLILLRSEGNHDPGEVMGVAPCMYIEIVPRAA